MAYPKGKPRPPGSGRQKGTVNKATAEVRETIAKVAKSTAPKLQQWLDDIQDTGKRMDLFLRMLEYHVPKLGRVEHTGEDGGPLSVRVVTYGDRTAQPLATTTVSTQGVERSGTGVPPRRTLPPPKGG